MPKVTNFGRGIGKSVMDTFHEYPEQMMNLSELQVWLESKRPVGAHERVNANTIRRYLGQAKHDGLIVEVQKGDYALAPLRS